MYKRQAYPISDTMAVVRKRTELNGRGRFKELPDTRLMAMASPMALPVPSTTAVMIPDFAAGTMTWNMVCILVAPRARDALLRWPGTARREDSLILITVGRRCV